MNSGKIIQLSSDAEFTKLVAASKSNPLMVDFFATWCGPCKSLSPKLEAAANKEGFTLCCVNVDNFQELSNKYNVSSIPHVFLFIDGTVAMDFVGCDEQALQRMIELAKKHINKFSGTGVSLGSVVKASANMDTTPIPDEPAESDSCYNIKFNFNGKVFERRFEGTNTIGQVRAYVRKETNAGNVNIFTPFPRKVYDNDYLTIVAAGLGKHEMLNVALQ